MMVSPLARTSIRLLVTCPLLTMTARKRLLASLQVAELLRLLSAALWAGRVVLAESLIKISHSMIARFMAAPA